MSSPSSIASSATPTNTDSMENPAGGGSSSTLYLYTFLVGAVTLILLLSVSIIIVGRSYLLRRRFRRQVEEALRNGHVLSPDAPGLIGLSNSITSKLLGPPPKLWDVWVQPATVTKPSFDTEVASSGKFPWTEVRVSDSVAFDSPSFDDTGANLNTFAFITRCCSHSLRKYFHKIPEDQECHRRWRVGPAQMTAR